MPVPNGDVAETPAQARAVAQKLGGRVVVKAQVHAGGRGKAGGVKLADDAAGAEAAASQILGMMLKTPQTPPEGIKVLKVLVEEASPIATELYLSMTLDRGRGTHVVMASQAGGMDIEEVAATHPERIIREWTDPALGLQAFQARNLAFGLGLKGDQFKAGVALIMNLFRAYLEKDCSLAEINPLVVTQGRPRAGARRQAQLRRQRALPPQGRRRAPRHQRGDAARRGGLEVRPQLHQARRQRRLHGERGRPRDGDDGHREAGRRRARQLPGRGRRRLARADRERLPHPLVRPEREGGLHQRVRRHSPGATGSPRASSPR